MIKTKSKESEKIFSEIKKTLAKYYDYGEHFTNEKYEINNPEMEYFMDNISSFVGVIDVHHNCYLYVSESCSSVLGLNQSDLYLKDEGLKIALATFHPEHALQFVNIIFPTFFEICQKNVANGAVRNMKMTYTNKIFSKGSYRWFHHTITVIDIDKNGMPLIAIKLINDIDDIKTDDNIKLVVSKKNNSGFYDIIFEKTIEAASNQISEVTSRESEIILLISQGLSSKSIADELSISPHTVNTHKKNMLKKLNLTSSSQLVRYAMANGILH